MANVFSSASVWVQELFKAFARYLSHLLAEGRSQGKGQGKAGGARGKAQARACDDLPETVRVCAPAVRAEATALIKRFFSQVQRCKSESDWEDLKTSHSQKTLVDKK